MTRPKQKRTPNGGFETTDFKTAALSVTAPYPAPCGAAAPAVPAASCRRLSVSLSAVSLAYSARAVLPISKSRDASPLPLRPAPVPTPACAALVRWMGGFGGGCNEKRPYRSRSVRYIIYIQIFLKMSNVSEVPTAM